MEKLRIWGEHIPYNRPEVRKQDVMDLRRVPKAIAQFAWLRDVFGTHIAKSAWTMDTWTYLDEIRTGKVSAYMDDVPTLTPYLVPEADTGVIVVPGGGFCYQDRSGEGEDIARYLNTCGISAFVLDYRMNPYEAPVFYLDLQRAIRYLRHNALRFHLNPHRIGTIGFSAGGYIVGAAAMLLGDRPVRVDGYVPDAIDQLPGRADSLALIYPVTQFAQNPNMLSVVAGDAFFDPTRRKELMRRYSLLAHMCHCMVPQFFCYGTRDPLRGMDRYAAALDTHQIPHKTVVLKGASHGFALHQPAYDWWADEYILWLRDLE